MACNAKVLVVDDEHYMAESLKTLLTHQGYRVATAASGDEAKKMLDKERFDLVLLDASLSDMNGQEVMDYVKARAPETVVIFLTGYASVDAAVKALKSGAYDYLRKPFECDELYQTIRNALNQRELKEDRDLIHTQLTISEDRYQFLIQNSPDIIYMLDEQGCFKFINKAVEPLLGFKPDEIIGKPYTEIIYGEDVENAKCFFNERRTGDRANTGVELRLKTKNSASAFRHYEIKHIIVELKASGFYDRPKKKENKEFLGTHGVARDINHRKRLEEQLLQDQRMKAIGTLAGGIAHDSNNLLMGIQGNISLILSNIDTSFPFIDHLMGIEEFVKSAADLTQQLLGFARGGKYEVKPTDINEIIEKSLEMFSRTKKELIIQTEYQNIIWSVEVDRGQMEQVLLNLYVNAWQSMPGGGHLCLKTENITINKEFLKPYGLEDGRFVKISVADNGAGMDKSTQERIFDPFFTTKELGRGTGLGLASVYGIIKNHGGTITVESVKGQGTTFDIFLPASEKRIENEKMKSETLSTGSGAILLIDDEGIILDVGKDMLELLGYQVYISQKGAEAISIFEKHKGNIDLILLDMIMPGMGGGEVYDRLKRIDPEVKVLLSSGYSIDGEATEILNRGCQGFIQKPFNIEKLSQKVKNILCKLK